MILSAIALHIYTFIDVLRTDRSQLPARLPKVAWAVLTLIVPILGPLLWLFFKNQHLFRSGTTFSAESFGGAFGSKQRPSGPVAPDDDPEFLARLEAQNRRRAYEENKRKETGKAEETTVEDTDEDGGLYGR